MFYIRCNCSDRPISLPRSPHFSLPKNVPFSLPKIVPFLPSNLAPSTMKPTVISSLLTVPILLIRAVLSATFDRPVPQVARQVGAGISSCVPWLSLVESCTAATSGFESLPFSVRASCLCYSSGLWQPSIYDGAFDTCAAYLATASPAFYSSKSGGTMPTDPCRLAGDVITTGSHPASPSPTMTTGASITSPSQPANPGACLSADLILASCALATSSFTNLPFTVEASCLCYTSGTYAPSVYDGYWAGCLGFYSTASPVYYSSLGGDVLPRTPCAGVEKIIGSTVPTSPTVSSSTTNTPNPSALTTVVSVVSTQSGAPGLRIESYTWLITVGVCFLTLI
jgi:hypothetical protein